MGAATFNLFYSFLAGLLMFIGLYVFALWTKTVGVLISRAAAWGVVQAREAGRALLARLLPAWRAAQARLLEALEGVDWSGTLATMTGAARKPRS